MFYEIGIVTQKSPMLYVTGGRVIDHAILGYVSRGTGGLCYDHGARQPIEPGACYYLPAGHHHLYDPDDGRTWDEYWMVFDAPELARSFGDILPHPGEVFYPRIDATLRKRWTEIRDLHYVGAETNKDRIIYLLHDLFYALHTAWRGPDKSVSISDPDILQAKRMIIQCIDKRLPLDPEAIAEECRMGYDAFRKKFRAITGVSPKQFYLDMKFLMACDLLKNSAMRIKEIACTLGYDDQYFFSRFFTKRAGYSPQSYRKKFQ